MGRLIDADEMLANENEAYNNSVAATNGTEMALPNLIAHLKIHQLTKDAPTVDAVRVVRCCQCAKRWTSMCHAGHEQVDMDYCSHGERKAGGPSAAEHSHEIAGKAHNNAGSEAAENER